MAFFSRVDSMLTPRERYYWNKHGCSKATWLRVKRAHARMLKARKARK
jgi:hypothetical protein